MDDKTLQALTLLAEKLSTTTEHLWAVLIRQAYIDGWLTIASLIVLTILCVVMLRFVIRKTTAPGTKDKYGMPLKAEWYEEGAFAAWTVAGIASTIVILLVIEGLPTAISALINPEYWALKQILAVLQ